MKKQEGGIKKAFSCSHGLFLWFLCSLYAEVLLGSQVEKHKIFCRYHMCDPP